MIKSAIKCVCRDEDGFRLRLSPDPIIQLIASLALAFVLYAASFPSVMDTLTCRDHYRGLLPR
ncbi:hypothetical protein LN650_21550 [Klebsiella pneumoniae subsp. pneumoniae]|nr:hypothetical protein [Klebsiella pneumoniae subsp. pneumoniae]